MSDTADQESREQEASEEKLKQARERGDTPSAPDVWLLGSLTAVSLALNLLARFTTGDLVRALGNFFETCSEIYLSNSSDAITL